MHDPLNHNPALSDPKDEQILRRAAEVPRPDDGQLPEPPPFADGIRGFPDTFIGPADKAYADRRQRELSRLRGFDVYYYVQNDQVERIDGDQPLSNVSPVNDTGAFTQEAKPPGPFQGHRRGGNISIYGEPVIIKDRIDSTKREVIPDWNYAQPVKIRAYGFQPSQEEEADERGTIVTKKVKLHIARILCEEAKIFPRFGDVIRLPVLMDSFYDVLHADRDAHRFGASGFFTAFQLDLVRSTKFEPQRKNLPGNQAPVSPGGG